MSEPQRSPAGIRPDDEIVQVVAVLVSGHAHVVHRGEKLGVQGGVEVGGGHLRDAVLAIVGVGRGHALDVVAGVADVILEVQAITVRRPPEQRGLHRHRVSEGRRAVGDGERLGPRMARPDVHGDDGVVAALRLRGLRGREAGGVRGSHGESLLERIVNGYAEPVPLLRDVQARVGVIHLGDDDAVPGDGHGGVSRGGAGRAAPGARHELVGISAVVGGLDELAAVEVEVAGQRIGGESLEEAPYPGVHGLVGLRSRRNEIRIIKRRVELILRIGRRSAHLMLPVGGVVPERVRGGVGRPVAVVLQPVGCCDEPEKRLRRGKRRGAHHLVSGLHGDRSRLALRRIVRDAHGARLVAVSPAEDRGAGGRRAAADGHGQVIGTSRRHGDRGRGGALLSHVHVRAVPRLDGHGVKVAPHEGERVDGHDDVPSQLVGLLHAV